MSGEEKEMLTGQRQLSDEQAEELKALCVPVIEFLRKLCDPYYSVVIEPTHIRLTLDQVGIPFLDGYD